jgi:hypothetical protein
MKALNAFQTTTILLRLLIKLMLRNNNGLYLHPGTAQQKLLQPAKRPSSTKEQ